MLTQTLTSVKNELDVLMKISPDQFSIDNRFELENLFRYCTEGAETDSQKLICSLIIKAFNRRIQSASINDHIYLNKSETPQIELFRILIEQFPFVKYSQLIVNNAILDAMEKHDEVAIMDIGIGQGVQMMHLLQKASHLPHLKKVRIIGIEPFADALSAAEQAIMDFAQQAPFQIEFQGICEFAELVAYEKLATPGTPLIVNASLALHHIQSRHDRKRTLSRIRGLQPEAFFLIEPNVDHMEPDVYRRYESCYAHYYHLFCVIDQLEISQADRNALKLFFGREIQDVLGNEEKHRFERHEPATSWLRQLRETGFAISSEKLEIPASGEYGVKLRHHDAGFLGFTFEQETILAVIYAH